jgi:ectonucleoside triphosphate diphosphohydrolase 4
LRAHTPFDFRSAIRTGRNPDLAIIDPCLNHGMNDSIEIGDNKYFFQGSGDFYQCQQLLTPLLNKTESCVKEPCSLNGVFQPEINPVNSEFYGFAEFFYTMEDILHIGGSYHQVTFSRAAQVGNIENIEIFIITCVFCFS